MLYTKAHAYFGTKSDREMQQKLLALLESKKWNVSRVANHMGVSPVTVWRIIREYPALTKARIAARIAALQKVS
jgi:transcriptional regulator of acetoin/glycerol metabolism